MTEIVGHVILSPKDLNALIRGETVDRQIGPMGAHDWEGR